MQRYFGWVDEEGRHVKVSRLHGSEELARPPSWHGWQPGVYGWGKHTSGSWLLAAAILADVTLDSGLTHRLTPYFREEVVALLPEASWEMTALQVRAWIDTWDKSALDAVLEGVPDAELERRG